jgi:geranylgeranyl diphosphate synthase, type II
MAGCPVSPGSLAPGSPSMLLGPDMSASVAPPITRSLDDVRAFVEPRLEAALDLSGEAAPRLVAAMRHALLAPGKRLRPALVLWAADACGGSRADAAGAAIAVEMIHAYSLVHDDLPAMDDDDLRRGQPTCHKAFDEATAILCGDALQALAFETLAREMPPATAARGCLVLARAAGAEALVGGQADDLAAERGWIADMTAAPAGDQVAWLERIHRRKTGALFLAALELGGLAAGASSAQLAMLAAYGRAFGLAFQIADDILDAEGDEVTMGKRVGKDAGRGKLTFPTIVGLEESRSRAVALAVEAAEAVHGLGGRAATLEALARWIVARDH